MTACSSGWLIWHEDIQGPGRRVAFQKQKAADEAIGRQLDYIITGVEREVVAFRESGHTDEQHDTLEQLARDIRRALAADDITAAISYWRDFEEEDEQAVMESFGRSDEDPTP